MKDIPKKGDNMNKTLRNIGIMMIVTLGIGVIWSLFSDNFWLGLIDHLFLEGLIMVVIGGFLFLSEKGLFRIASYSVKKVRWMFMQHGKDYVDEKLQEMKGKRLTLQNHMQEPLPEYGFTYPILVPGILYTIISLAVSFSMI